MKFRVIHIVSCLLFLSLNLHAQRGSSGHGTTGSTGTTTPSTTVPPPASVEQFLILSGNVVTEDGSALPAPASIHMTCKGRKQSLGYTDSKGSFSIQLSNRAQPAAVTPDPEDSAASTYSNGSTYNPAGSQPGFNNWQDCEIEAEVPGYSSPTVDLASRISGAGDPQVNLGNLALHRVARVEGYTISVTSAAAPAKARKAFEKGLALASGSQWAAAQAKFQAAVDAYPKYAEAWFELGRAQLQQGNEADARHSFQQAVIADPKFIQPYRELAQLAAKGSQWQDLADSAAHLVTLNSGNYPQYWFLSAVAHYNLRDFEKAHQDALHGLAVDAQHRVPDLEDVLGLVLIQLHDYPAAEEHLRNYLRIAPNGPNAEQAEEKLGELERLLAAASSKDEADSDDDTPADDH